MYVSKLKINQDFSFFLQYTEQIHYLSEISKRSNQEILKDIFKNQRKLYETILSCPHGLYGFASILPRKKEKEKKLFRNLADLSIQEYLIQNSQTKFNLEELISNREITTDKKPIRDKKLRTNTNSISAFDTLTQILDNQKKSSERNLGSMYNQVHELIDDLKLLFDSENNQLDQSLIYPKDLLTKTKQFPELVQKKWDNLKLFHELYFESNRTEFKKILNQRLKLQNLAKELVNQNLKLVLFAIKKYEFIKRYNIVSEFDYFKIISLGNLALVNSAFHFDYRTGTKFSTYAMFSIKSKIEKGLTEDNPLNVKMNFFYALKEFKKNINELESQLGREGSEEEIRRYYKMNNLKISNYVFKKLMRGKPVQITAKLDSLSIEPNIENPSSKKKAKNLLLKSLKELDKRERRVIESRFELNNSPKLKLKELSIKLGISVERVRQIEHRALKKLELKLSTNKDFILDAFNPKIQSKSKYLIFATDEEC